MSNFLKGLHASTPMTNMSDPVFDAVQGAYEEIIRGDKV